MSESEQTSPPVADLVDAGVPADQGLASLGMIMQLAGNVFAALGAVISLYALTAEGRMAGNGASVFLFALLAAGTVRSLFQHNAGTQLLYGAVDGGRLVAMRRYIQLGIAHSLAFGALLAWKFDVSVSVAASVAAGLALWPVTLAVVFSLPRFRKFRDNLPIAEDKGFEGAAILMTVLGLCGLFAAGGVLIWLLDMPRSFLQHGPTVLVVLAVGMLVVRSAMHVRAGFSGLRETSLDRSVERVHTYANFAVIAAFCCGGAMLLLMMSESINLIGLGLVCALVWMLMAWPMVVRRFYAERQFADLLAGADAPVHRRAPDAGASALGWLLFAHAAYGASFAIPSLTMSDSLGRDGGYANILAAMSGAHGCMMIVSLAVIVLQGFAGFELVRASRRARIVATAYGVVSAAFTLYMQWPILAEMRRTGDLSTSLAIVPLALSLVVPIATILLVNRQIAPTMQARFRTPPPQP
jgi:hypothetical protein